MKFRINIFSKSQQKLFSLSLLLKLDKPQFYQYSPQVAQRPDPLGLSISNAFQSSHFMCIVKQLTLRDGFKKSKWKFKMAFAMKGGAGSRGGLECHIPILKNDFC